MDAPIISIPAINQATEICLSIGIRILQTHRYDPDDVEHVATLLEWLSPAPGARVMDAGCGIGDVSKHMSELRQDLSFLLVNLSEFQLSMAPRNERFSLAIADCAQLPMASPCIDAAIFLSSLCQMDAPLALLETGRVMLPGGVLLIADMTRICGSNADLESALAMRAYTPGQIIGLAEQAGFNLDCMGFPDGDDSTFKDLFDSYEQHDQLFANVRHTVFRFVKEPNAI